MSEGTTMRYNTERYLLAHGKTPRGFGSWVISVDFATAERGTATVTRTVASRGTVAEARANAVRQIRSEGHKGLRILEVRMEP